METLDLQTSNILEQAIREAQIIENFQYGHNLIQSPVQINEIFSMLETILKKVLKTIDDVIPDINLAPYADGYVDPSRANLCWIELADNYYGLMLNTHKGIKYRQFSEDDIQSLILDGQIASWYLVSKIQNISYLLSSGDSSLNVSFFKNLIIDIIERFFKEHESSQQYHPAGMITLKNIDKLLSRLQIQNSSSVVPAPKTVSSTSKPTWSTSIIKTPTGDICWQSAPDLKLKPIESENVLDIIMSKYLNKRSDVAAFLKSTYLKHRGNKNNPNVFCFLSQSVGGLSNSYINLNYEVTSQLNGKAIITYENGEEEEFIPDTHPIVIEKGKNDIAFLVIIKLDNNITRKVKSIDVSNLLLCCSMTGIIELRNEE